MKSVLLSIRPEWTARILSGEKTIEVRKKFPKDYQGWVYIYCTKGKMYLKQCEHFRILYPSEIANKGYYLNGKVVARFWCDKVEETFYQKAQYDEQLERILKDSCLTDDQLWEYADNDTFYAVHIRKLEIFDEPKELSELGIKTSPQNYCYLEKE